MVYKEEHLQMQGYRKLTAIFCAAVLTLGLAACGGGGGNGNGDTGMQMPEQTPDPAIAERTAISNAIMAAQTAVGMVTDDASDATVTAADNAIAAAKKAIADAANVPAEEKTANSGTVAAIETALTNAKTSRTAAMKDTSTADAKAAMALFNGFADAGNDGTADLTLGTLTVTDKHGGSATVVAADTGAAPAVKATDTVVPMLGMWKGTELAGDTAGEMPSNTVVVYTNVEAAKAVPFGEVHTLTNDALPIVAAADTDAHVKLISAADFTHAGRKNHDPDPTSATDVARIRGMFNGASGEYRCTAAAADTCGSIESSMGVRLTTGWVFDPDSGAMAMQADTSYAYFGWWLRMAGGTATPEVVAFHGVTDPTGADAQLAAPADISALGGTATYSGAAAGKYAINPGLSAASGGHWTADATLTADWGSETAAGTISGTVNNFMAGGEMMDWSVALGETVLSGTGAFDTAADTSGDTGTNAVVWTIDGVAGAEAGAWSGGLRAAGDNDVPGLATGMFSATHGTVGHMVGAFGAHVE